MCGQPRPEYGNCSRLSAVYMARVNPTCFKLDRQLASSAFCFALDSAGNNIAARMAMMAMTTSNSMSVKPRRVFIGDAISEAGTRAMAIFFRAVRDGRRFNIAMERGV